MATSPANIFLAVISMIAAMDQPAREEKRLTDDDPAATLPPAEAFATIDEPSSPAAHDASPATIAPTSRASRLALWYSHPLTNIGVVESEGYRPSARDHLETAQTIRRKLLSTIPEDTKVEHDLAMGSDSLAKFGKAQMELTFDTRHKLKLLLGKK